MKFDLQLPPYRAVRHFSTVFISLLVSYPIASAAPDGGGRERWAEAQRKLADGGDGFLVWESNRSGEWRVWTCALDGSTTRMLSPDEKGNTHVAPSISPDGRQVAYLSIKGGDGNYKDGGVYALHLVGADGRGDRVLVPKANLGSGGNRAVVWISQDELIFLDEKGRAVRLGIRTGQKTELTGGGGYLVNRTLTHAFERFYFHRYDPAKKEVVKSGKKYGGCEPCFSFDGKWGIRMTRPVGPISRVDLVTGVMESLVEKDDKRMPKERNYVYFPMVSRCGRLLTFAASENQHDHFKSDYDIFVAPVDAKTLMLRGDPVRYTFDPKTDRYPDVYLSDLPLGQHVGEAPLTVKFFSTGDVGGGRWTYGGGREVTPGVARFDAAAEYLISREFGGRTERGRVSVSPKKAPAASAVYLRDNRHLEVVFDELIDPSRASVSLASGLKVVSIGPDKSGRGIVVGLGEDFVKEEDVLGISGVVDRAQEPNAMAPAKLKVKRASWPFDPAGLAFAWERAGGVSAVPTPGGEIGCPIAPQGRARLNRHGSMLLHEGAFLADEEAAERVRTMCQTSNALSIEAVFLPANLSQEGPARIVTLSENQSGRNFTLGQEKDRLILRVRTPKTGSNGSSPQLDLCGLQEGKAHHVIATYSEGKAICYLNGEKVSERGEVTGDFSNWSRAKLLIGDEAGGGRDWAGIADGIAIYSRVINAEEARRNFQAASSRWRKNATDGVGSIEVEAELVRMSEMPAMAEILPYKEALVVGEYQVKSVRSGGLAGVGVGKVVCVARWAILGGKAEAVSQEKAGTKVIMRLEPKEAQGQIENLLVKETLSITPDVEIFYDSTL